MTITVGFYRCFVAAFRKEPLYWSNNKPVFLSDVSGVNFIFSNSCHSIFIKLKYKKLIIRHTRAYLNW